MRIVLTGSSGWLGRFLAPMLQQAGHTVLGLDVAAGENTSVLGSVANPETVRRVFADQRIDAVVHAGALHKPDLARYPSQAFVDVNVTGTLHLLQAAVKHGVSRFVFTSTTSLMISRAIRNEEGSAAAWLDESAGPLEPRNAYGVTKLAAEGFCRTFHMEHGLPCIVLRTSRFFPEEDDTHRQLAGENLKANELLYRRLTVEDAARAHLLALERAPDVGFDVLIVSAPTPFVTSDVEELKRDAPTAVARYFPEAQQLYAKRGWTLPATIGRVYDPSRAERVIGFRAQTDFRAVLTALRAGLPLPFAHNPAYVSPQQLSRTEQANGPDAASPSCKEEVR